MAMGRRFRPRGGATQGRGPRTFLLLVLAFTSIAMNLRHEVFRPVVQLFATVSPEPFKSLPERPPADAAARRDWQQAVQAARAHLPAPSMAAAS